MRHGSLGSSTNFYPAEGRSCGIECRIPYFRPAGHGVSGGMMRPDLDALYDHDCHGRSNPEKPDPPSFAARSPHRSEALVQRRGRSPKSFLIFAHTHEDLSKVRSGL